MNYDELKKNISGEILSNESDLASYSRDASIFEVKPQLVVKPKDADDIKNLVKFVSENKSTDYKLSLTARAGGSDMTGGPLNESIILDFTAYYNTLLEIQRAPSEDGGWAIAEPGVWYRDFEKETLKKGMLLPSYPASRELCAVGGMVANNAGGEKSLHYGKTDNYVEELNVVLSDGNEYVLKPLNVDELEQKKSQNDFEGEVYRKMHELLVKNQEIIQKARPNVSKNSAGYALWDVLTPGSKFDPVRNKTSADHAFQASRTSNGIDLTKLFVGSQGTLGIITKIKFRLIKPAKYSQLLVLFLKELDKVGDLVVALNKYDPESMESYDDNTIKLTFKILPGLIKKMRLATLFRFIPDFWVIMTGGIPRLVILTEFTGDDEENVKRKVKNVKQEIDPRFNVKSRIITNKANVQKYWTIRRESFNLLRKHVKDKKTIPFIDDIIVRPHYLPEFLPELNKILGEYKNYMTHTIAGHPGDGNFHVIPLMNLSDEKSRQIIPELSGKVYDLVVKYGGSITAEHNDGLIRTPYLEKMYGPEVCRLFGKVKEIFDPLNIFNPGKKVNGNLDYAMEHIKTSL